LPDGVVRAADDLPRISAIRRPDNRHRLSLDPRASFRIARRFTDIAIRPFQTRQQGMTFGLVDESAPDRGDWAALYPDRLGFNPPWDGTNST
jgi:hypothetical protein